MLKFTVKQARMYADISQKEMSDFLEMCKETYIAKEKNPGKFSIAEGRKISLKTGVPMDLLIF